MPSNENGLDFLPSGPGHGATSSVVDPQTLRSLLAAARTEYEAIVVSGPATIGSAVTLLLAAQVDQTLFAVFPGRSRWGQLADSEQLAVSSGLAVGGSILHAGRGVRSLTLQTDRRSTVPSRAESEAATEENLRTDIAELQQDLTESVTHNVERPETSAPDREPTA